MGGLTLLMGGLTLPADKEMQTPEGDMDVLGTEEEASHVPKLLYLGRAFQQS